MLTIGRRVNFGLRGQALFGQTPPDATNWRLRWFSRGEEVPLFIGSYAQCRRIQDACLGMTDVEEIKRIVDKLGLRAPLPAEPFRITATQPTEVYPPVADLDADGPSDFDFDFDGTKDKPEDEPATARRRKKRRSKK